MKFTVYYSKEMDRTPRDLSPAAFDKIAEVEGDEPDDVFREMNAVDGTETCCKLRVRSMSVGDVLVAENGISYLCESAGWKRITFVV